MKGLDVYKTRDGFTVAKVHYTADPDKDPDREGKVWFENALHGVPGGVTGALWRKEMEIDFTAYSGQLLCFDTIERHRNKIVRHYPIKDYYYKYGALDWGRNNPCCFTEYIVGEDKHIHANYEIYLSDISVPQFCELIKKAPHYKEYMWIVADPSLWSRTQEAREGLRSLADIFFENKLYITKSKSRDDEIAIEELMTRWDHLDVNEPRLTISPRCPKMIWEFERLRYKELSTAMMEKANPHEQLIDKDNHTYDAYKYFISTWLVEPAQRTEREALRKDSIAYYVDQDRNLLTKNWREKYGIKR